VILAVLGKGGVGKTTISALLVRRLIELGETPVLAIDADPASCLAAALGVGAGPSLGDLREAFRDESQRPAGMTKADWLALRAEEAIVEARGFDLLTMGRPEGPGCYCFVNNLIRDHLDRLARGYRHVVIDCEAGLEHLSRRTTGEPDLLVAVTGTAARTVEVALRGLAVYRSLHGALPRLHLVVNNVAEGEDASSVEAALQGDAARPDWRASVPRDPAVVDRSLLAIPADSPAVRALAAWEPRA